MDEIKNKLIKKKKDDSVEVYSVRTHMHNALYRKKHRPFSFFFFVILSYMVSF